MSIMPLSGRRHLAKERTITVVVGQKVLVAEEAVARVLATGVAAPELTTREIKRKIVNEMERAFLSGLGNMYSLLLNAARPYHPRPVLLSRYYTVIMAYLAMMMNTSPRWRMWCWPALSFSARVLRALSCSGSDCLLQKAARYPPALWSNINKVCDLGLYLFEYDLLLTVISEIDDLFLHFQYRYPQTVF